MTRYSVQPRDHIFVKGYAGLSFAKNMVKNIIKDLIKNVSTKYSQKLLDHAKQSVIDTLKTSLKRVIHKIKKAEIKRVIHKKKQKQFVILLVIKLQIKAQRFQKIHKKIIQRQLQLNMIKK